MVFGSIAILLVLYGISAVLGARESKGMAEEAIATEQAQTKLMEKHQIKLEQLRKQAESKAR